MTEEKDKIDPKEITFTVEELMPILKEWREEIIKDNHNRPPFTKYPQVRATKLDGTPGSLEELLVELNIPIPGQEKKVEKEMLNKPGSIKNMDLFVNIFLNKPKWISEFFWKREWFQRLFKWLLRNNATVTVVDKQTLEERIAYDSKQLP